MDKRLLVRNRIDKPLFECLGHLSSDKLNLINSIYDETDEEDVLNISISLRENVDLDVGNQMSDEFMSLINSKNYHQKLISRPSIENPTSEYDWNTHDSRYDYIITAIKEIIGVKELYRLRMAWMKSSERIEPHIDQPHIDRFTMIMRGEHRFVITKRGKDYSQIMKPGDIWYINTNWDHSVYIDTDEPRLALLGCFDYNK